jgi:hypothetical protein
VQRTMPPSQVSKRDVFVEPSRQAQFGKGTSPRAASSINQPEVRDNVMFWALSNRTDGTQADISPTPTAACRSWKKRSRMIYFANEGSEYRVGERNDASRRDQWMGRCKSRDGQE